MPTTIETDLKDILGEFKQQFSHLNQRLDTIPKDPIDLKISQAEMRGDIANLKTELTLTREDVKDLTARALAQIWALIITVIGATSAAVIKFGFFSSP